MRKELNDPKLKSAYEKEHSSTPGQILKRGILVPTRLLFSSPITFILSLYMSIVYGLLYLLFTTITTVYESTYGWSPQLCGLAYLGIGLGFFLGLGVVGKTNDKTVTKLTAANGGVFEPEMRLAACGLFALFVPISFFWYGWSVDKQAHWIVPIVGLLPFGFGMVGESSNIPMVIVTNTRMPLLLTTLQVSLSPSKPTWSMPFPSMPPQLSQRSRR